MTRLLLPLVTLAIALSPLPARAETIRVTVERVAFVPARIEAKVGDTVEWVNRDVVVHTATVRGGFDVNLPVGKAGSVVLRQAGTLEYYCRLHPNMKGAIAVTPP